MTAELIANCGAAAPTFYERRLGLRGRRIVITDASPRTGRTIAHCFAREGATIMLAARRQAPLEDAAKECRSLGGRAVWLTTDVSCPLQMRVLARTAVEEFGGIDVWINNAAVTLRGRFSDIPLQRQQRTLEVNVGGVIKGSYAAAAEMRAAGGRGVIINVASAAPRTPLPLAATYTAAEQAIAGFTDALRREMATETDISVCGLFTYFVAETADRSPSAELMPAAAMVDAAAVAEAVLALASAEFCR